MLSLFRRRHEAPVIEEKDPVIELAPGILRDDSDGPGSEVYCFAAMLIVKAGRDLGLEAEGRAIAEALMPLAYDAEGVPRLAEPIELTEADVVAEATA